MAMRLRSGGRCYTGKWREPAGKPPGRRHDTVRAMTAQHSTSPKNLLLVMPYHQLTRKATEAGLRAWSVWDPASPEADLLAEVAWTSDKLLVADLSDEAGLRQL